MNHKERMLANLPYKAWLDGLSEERLENKKKILNVCDDCNNAVGEFIEQRQDAAKEEMLKNELGGN